jgi:hypothetical protein
MSDEKELWEAFPITHKTPRDAGLALGIHPKRVCYLCSKWAKKGNYEYGVTVDLGWKRQGIKDYNDQEEPND